MAGARPINSTNIPRAAAQVATLEVPLATDRLPLPMAGPHFSTLIEGGAERTPGSGRAGRRSRPEMELGMRTAVFERFFSTRCDGLNRDYLSRRPSCTRTAAHADALSPAMAGAPAEHDDAVRERHVHWRGLARRFVQPRETMMCRGVSTGMLDERSAGRLGVAGKPVKVHRGQVMQAWRALGHPVGERGGQSRCITRAAHAGVFAAHAGVFQDSEFAPLATAPLGPRSQWCRARTLIRLGRLRNFRQTRSFGRIPGRADIAAPQMEIEE